MFMLRNTVENIQYSPSLASVFCGISIHAFTLDTVRRALHPLSMYMSVWPVWIFPNLFCLKVFNRASSAVLCVRFCKQSSTSVSCSSMLKGLCWCCVFTLSYAKGKKLPVSFADVIISLSINVKITTTDFVLPFESNRKIQFKYCLQRQIS